MRFQNSQNFDFLIFGFRRQRFDHKLFCGFSLVCCLNLVYIRIDKFKKRTKLVIMPKETKERKKDLFKIEQYDPKAEFEPNPKHLDGVQDMSNLIYLEGPNILHNLDVRYGRDEIYTSISKVLIAVNPYKQLGCYSPELIMQYRELATRRNTGLPSHVFSISQSAYYQMTKYGVNQSMIVCGESGSGKTETAKHLMRYLAYSPASELDEKVSIEKQVLDVNPILESIGNAKTLLNNNSSRFGKFTKLIFKKDYSSVLGSIIETYLLEKSRLVRQDPGKHIFSNFFTFPFLLI